MNTHLVRAASVLTVLGLAVACGGDDGTSPENGNGNNPPTLSGDVQPILTANCTTGCHGGAQPILGQNLSEGQTIASTVNVASSELPTMDRIEPGEPDNSYLVNKIQGTQASVGGIGERMTLNRDALTQEQIDIVRAWIADGAKDN